MPPLIRNTARVMGENARRTMKEGRWVINNAITLWSDS
jgi:hypothetical protein